MTDAIVSNLVELIFLLITALTLYFVRTHLNKRLAPSEKKLLEQLAKSTVLYVQQTQAGSDATQKLSTALEHLVMLAESSNLDVNIVELRVLIESQLLLLKYEFGEAWAQE